MVVVSVVLVVLVCAVCVMEPGGCADFGRDRVLKFGCDVVLLLGGAVLLLLNLFQTFLERGTSSGATL